MVMSKTSASPVIKLDLRFLQYRALQVCYPVGLLSSDPSSHEIQYIDLGQDTDRMLIFGNKNNRGFKELGQHILQDSIGGKDRNG